jgi:alpha-D-ribose 1-methylphosphonate 5-triphosphate synthase subunit PhnG
MGVATADGDGHEARRRWIGALARAPRADLETAFAALDPPPAYRLLRRPEIGLVMVRARAGGTGGRFNLGEMSVVRCAVALDDGTTGFGYVAGRDARHAELAAVFDALMQDGARRPALEAALIAPALAAVAAHRRRTAAKAAATGVDFFTLVRGEDPS